MTLRQLIAEVEGKGFTYVGAPPPEALDVELACAPAACLGLDESLLDLTTSPNLTSCYEIDGAASLPSLGMCVHMRFMGRRK